MALNARWISHVQRRVEMTGGSRGPGKLGKIRVESSEQRKANNKCEQRPPTCLCCRYTRSHPSSLAVMRSLSSLA